MENVTVIVPVYNAEAYLDRCIESIVNQTYQGLEILLLDDGSTDKSLEICKGWEKKDRRIQVISKCNEGLGPTRNRGLAMASNDMVVFVDADDWMERAYIESLARKMLSEESDICLCDLYYWNSRTGERTLSQIRFDGETADFRDDASVMNKIRTFAWGKLWKKELFDDGCLFPGWTFEDIPVVPLLAYKARKISYVREGLYNYWRDQPQSLSMQGNHIPDIQKSLHLLKKRGDAMGLPPGAQMEIKKIMLGQVRFAYKRWFVNEAYRGALRELTESLAGYYPCFENYEDIIFKKSDNEMINEGIRRVVFSDSQISDKAGITLEYPDRLLRDEEIDRWEIAEYIMEQM